MCFPFSGVDCQFQQGDGVGGYEIEVSRRPMTTEKCINACERLKNRFPGINGVTVHQSGFGRCYCEIGMTSWNQNKEWKSCMTKQGNYTFMPIFTAPY